MANQIVSQKQCSNYKDRIKKNLIDHEKEFWEAYSNLPALEKCKIYLALLPYGFSKAPEERALDSAGKQRLILEETQRKATLISGGLPPAKEYEEAE